MNEHLPYKDYTRRSKKWKHCKSCAFWSDDLKQLWDSAHNAEKVFLRHRGPRSTHNELCIDYKRKQGAFDKCSRQAKRIYEKDQRNRISQLSTSDPSQFWRENIQSGTTEHQ